jgi:hypothetical protein
MENNKAQSYDIFRLERFALLFRRDLAANYRTLLIAAAAVAALVLVSSLLGGWQHGQGNSHPVLYLQVLFIGGYLVSSRAFREIHHPHKAYTYVLLPASSLEKFAERLLATSLVYVLGTLAAYLAVAGLSELLNRLLFGFSQPLFNPFGREMLLALAAYMITQSLFVLGSVWFRKTVFLKTLLVLFLLGIVTALIAYLAMALLLLPEYFDGLKPAHNLELYFETMEHQGWRGGGVARVFRAAAVGARIFFWGLLAPLCWVLSYRRFRRIEV